MHAGVSPVQNKHMHTKPAVPRHARTPELPHNLTHAGDLPAQFKQRLEALLRSGQAHPKMARLHDAVLAHFRGLDPAQELHEGSHLAQGDPPGYGALAPGRVIVFTSFRDSVGAIVEMFRAEDPLISARSNPGP